jgi:BioD-like phosphotransacetylase family protein
VVALYLTSGPEGAGKTTIGAGLGKHFQDIGKRLGYFKPVIADDKAVPAGENDSDSVFMKRVFSLKEPLNQLCPMFNDDNQLKSNLMQAYEELAKDKDIVIIEAVTGQEQLSRDIVAALAARVIVVQGYSGDLPQAIERYKYFGKDLMGVVLNKVPGNRLEYVRATVVPQLENTGIKVLGILPENRMLLAPAIGELAQYIQGDIVQGAEKSAELVENFMLGALGADPGTTYFARKANKAVILKSERPDMQLAALETSTRCLILTGNTTPKPIVLHRAEEKTASVILAKGDVNGITSLIESALNKAKFHQDKKLSKLDEMMQLNFNFAALDAQIV